MGFFLFDRAFEEEELVVTDIGTSFEFDKIKELFSLSLELRSIDTVRFGGDAVLSNKKK
jgi:hypothetical protein